MNAAPEHTLSIQVRLRRTTVEDCYISAPITNHVMSPGDDGVLRPDMDILWEDAIALSAADGVEWRREDVAVAAHPVQGPLPADRTAYVPSADETDWWDASGVGFLQDEAQVPRNQPPPTAPVQENDRL